MMPSQQGLLDTKNNHIKTINPRLHYEVEGFFYSC